MMAYQERVQTLCTMRFARSDGSTTKRNIVMMDVMKWIKGHEGLKDAHIEGAQELIDLIHQFGDIELNIEC